jgi:tetratricopeptide (TPR) repeat protein
LPLGFGVIAPLGLAGLVLARREWRRHLHLHLMLLVYVLTAVAFFVSAEYRAPVVPVILLFAAHTVFVAWVGLRSRPTSPARRTVLLAAVLVPVLAVATNVRTPLLRSQSLKRVDYLNFGTLYKKKGDLAGARRMLEHALAIDPRYAPAYAVLAEVEDLAGNELEAARLAALGRRFHAAGTPFSPGEEMSAAMLEAGELYRSRRHAEALQRFEGLLARAEASGDSAAVVSILNNVGLCRYKLGEHERAAEIFTGILARDPGYVKAYNNLGMVREAQGRLEEAIAQYQRALGIDPANAVATRALGRLRAGG